MVVFRKLALFSFFIVLAGCQSFQPEPPPPYYGEPQEISTNQTSGLQFVKTITMKGMSAEDDLLRYAKSHNYRYYVVVRRHYYHATDSNSFGQRQSHRHYDMSMIESVTAMMYR